MAFGTDTVCCEGIKKAIPVKQDRKQQEARASCCLFHVKIRFSFFIIHALVADVNRFPTTPPSRASSAR